jgi:hypothetical protein
MMTQRVSRLAWFVIRLGRVSFAKRDKDRLRRLRTLAISVTFMLPRRLLQQGYVTETVHVEQIAFQAAREYKPSPVKANVLLFKSEVRPTGSFMGNDMGWAAVLGRPVHVNSLPGNHNEIFHPVPAGIMAGLIRQALGLKSEVTSQT